MNDSREKGGTGTPRLTQTFWVFDTFDGFSTDQIGNDAVLEETLLDKDSYWVAPLEKNWASFTNFTTTEFVESNVQFVPGLFKESLPAFHPNRTIALL